MKRMMGFITVLCITLLISGTSGYAKNARSQGKGQGRAQGRIEQDRRGSNRAPDHDRNPDSERDRDRDRKDRDEVRENRFEDRLERNPQVRERLERMLPAGMSLRTAASGFRNQGQFIAALHVSKNLGIPFTQLKSRMTGDQRMSLGQAIHDLKPSIAEKDAHREVERAEKQARETARTKRIS